ncbi:MFS transporter [Desulfuromonas sp. CSMB_57]|uniref:MFS transporter n=1 Tax=Desulfuromonas sp. CSMB_57 TaxID=2807629 RepID=UPI0020C16C92|nr:MFS transporter [Desulfuromonas sp. CSMB_57]
MPLDTNISRLYVFAFLKMTLFPMAIITLFWKDHIGLSLTEILVLQGLFSVASVVMEYPSGYISDRLGYRASLLIATLFGILGWSFYLVAATFTGVLLAELMLGVCYAFISGSDSALLFETLRAGGREEQYARCDGRMTGWGQIGEAGGALFAGLLYATAPLLPFVLQIGVWSLALLLALSLCEPPVEEVPAIKSHLAEALSVCRYALWDNPAVRNTMLFGTLLGLASFYTVWLIQPYMQQTGVPLAWFGPAWAGANLMVAAGSLASHRLRNLFGLRFMAGLFILLIVTAYAGLGLTAAVGSFLFYFLLTFMRGLQGPLLRQQLQQAGSRRNRASILSLHSLLFRVGFVATGPLIGHLADQQGLGPTFLLLALLFALLLPLAAKGFLGSRLKAG